MGRRRAVTRADLGARRSAANRRRRPLLVLLCAAVAVIAPLAWLVGAGATTPPRPTVTGVSPTTATLAAGETVTVTGTGFTGATAVHFGRGLGTGIDVASSTSLTVHEPAGSGTVTVTVTTPGGTSATNTSDRFSYPAGEVESWGTGSLLGRSSTALLSPSSAPGNVNGLPPISTISVASATGPSRTTAAVLALATTGHVYAWGTNQYGRLGNGTTTFSKVPVEVSGVGGTGNLGDVTAVSVDPTDTYALGTTGHVYAWGSDQNGVLGDGILRTRLITGLARHCRGLNTVNESTAPRLTR